MNITDIRVVPGKMIATVELDAGEPAFCTPERARDISVDYPDLVRHACVNEKGETFGSVFEHTSMPHVLEHLVIDLQVRRTEDPEATFVGTTEWLSRKRQRACVQVSFRDDLVALKSLRDAVEYLNATR